MACDLCNDRRDGRREGKITIFGEKSEDTPEIDGREKVLEVRIEYVALVSMRCGVRDDREVALESVRQSTLTSRAGLFELHVDIQKKIRELRLVHLQSWLWRRDRATSAGFFGDGERFVLLVVGRPVQYSTNESEAGLTPRTCANCGRVLAPLIPPPYQIDLAM
jgi:hypothetical protein